MSEKEFNTAFDKMLDAQLMYAKQYKLKEITFEDYVVYIQHTQIPVLHITNMAISGCLKKIDNVQKTLNEMKGSTRL